MSGTGRCRLLGAIGGLVTRRAVFPAVVAALILACSPAASEAANLGTARFAGVAYSPNGGEVELWLGRWRTPTVSWVVTLEDVGSTVHVSGETSSGFEIMVSILSNGIDEGLSFTQEEGTECNSFTKSPGVSSEYCDFCGYEITALSLTVHSLEYQHGLWYYDVTLTILGEEIVPATMYYVDSDASGLDDGSNWANAYNYLQDALADANHAAKPVEIRVAEGVYFPDSNSAVPDGTGEREATFQLIDSVTIKGGYPGVGESEPNARDVELYRTVLSGDLGGNDGLYFANYDENSYSVVTGSWTDGRAVLDGFTITGGSADVDEGDIEGSARSSGGGMFSDHGSAMVRNCTFEWNRAQGGGGGMYNYDRSSPTLINCAFRHGEAFESSGGMRNHTHSNVTVINCIFAKNSSTWGTGGMSNVHYSNPTIKHCMFSGNTGRHGGGMTLANASGHGGTSLIANCIFSGNKARNRGALMDLSSEATYANCIFFGNRAVEGSAVIYSHRSKFINCIVYGNMSEYGWVIEGEPEISYSNVEGGRAGEGNIDADPCFADAGFWHLGRDPEDLTDDFWVEGSDYRLKSEAGRWDANEGRWTTDDVTSACIDAGNPLAPIGAEPFPNGGIVNMGAYGGTGEASKSYFGKPPCEIIVAGDVNGDCAVDFLDFRLMALHWCEDNNP